MKERRISQNLIALAMGALILCGLTGTSWAADHSGIIASDTTWYAADNPHVIVGDVTVPAGVTLTLEDGVGVQFNGGRSLKISGTLTAAGTSGTGIVFTRSDASNGYGLQFLSGGGGTFDHCTIEYFTYAIYTYSGADTVSLSHCTIQNASNGIRANGGTVELSSDTLENNTTYGFYGDDVAPTLLDGNNVFENNPTGIYIRDVSGVNLSTGGTVRNNTKAGIHLYNCTGNATLDNLTLQGNGGTSPDYGAIYMQYCGEFTIGSGNTIGGVGQENSWPLSINIGSYPSLASSGNIPASGNTNDGIQVTGENTTASVTWRSLGIDYVVTANPIISPGGTLDIADGVTVRFDNGIYLRVDGTLNAPGSAGILFTRYQGGGAWNGLWFYGGSNGTLRHCTIEFAASNYGYAIYAQSTFPAIEHCTIRNNKYGIYSIFSASPALDTTNTIQDNSNIGVYFKQCSNPSVSNQTITGHNTTLGAIYMESCGEFTIRAGNTIGGVGQENSWPLTMNIGSYPSAASSGNIPTSGNTYNDIQVYGGSSADSLTWRKFTGLDYIITSNPTVAAGGMLAIEDGVNVKFNSARSVNISGTLKAVGTPGTGIVFTRSDASNGYGLQILSGGRGTFDHCTIEYFNYGIRTYSGADTVSVSNCTIQNNSYGMYALGGTVELSSDTLANNTTYGFYGEDIDLALLDGNNVFENNPIGIYLRNVSGVDLSTGGTVRNNTNAGIHLSNCTGNATLDNLILQGNGGTAPDYGAIYTEHCGAFTIGSGNTIGGSGQENSWPLSINIGSGPSAASDGNIPTSGNTNDDIQVTGGSTVASVTWPDVGLDYVVTNTPTISAGGTLNVSDSVTVMFENEKYLTVYGTLNAIGTGSILFTRLDPDGHWNGLWFYGGSGGTLRYCTIEYATSYYGYAIYGQSAFPAIEHCTIRNNKYGIYSIFAVSPALDTANTIQDNVNVGVYFKECTDPSISNQTITGHNTAVGAVYVESCGEFTFGSGNTIGGPGLENSWPLTINIGSGPSVASSGNIPASGNTNNAIQVLHGSTSDSITWAEVGADYIVTDTPTLSAGGALAIEDGVNVKFNSSQSLNIFGTLTAVGTPVTGILFTRSGGSDGYGLQFQSGGRGMFDHCTIEYFNYGIRAYSGADSISVSHCSVQNNGYGVYAEGGALSFVNNEIINNSDHGIYLEGPVPASFGSNLSEWNDIYDNGDGSDGRDLRNGTLNNYAPYVYWGTVISPEIDARIWDVLDDAGLGAVCYAPWSNADHDQTTALWLNIELENGAKSNSGDIYLDWTDYCGQEGVDHYVVYRSTTAGTKGDSLAGTTDGWYIDVGAAGTVGTNYYYTVEVVDGIGERFDSNQVGEFDVDLIN